MRSVYLFDIDGTLTFPSQKMDKDFVYFFLDWSKNKDFFLVGGSSYKSLTSQLPSSVLKRAKGIFSSMANELHIDNDMIYSNTWKPPIKLLQELLTWHSKSPYPNKKKKYIEHRVGMLNFTVAGRESDNSQRLKYFQWDQLHQERETIASDLFKKFPQLDIRLGGMISLDISPKDKNKSQAINWVRNLNKYSKILYFGDKGFKGGNDYDAKINIQKNKDGNFYDVKDCNQTKKILSSIHET